MRYFRPCTGSGLSVNSGRNRNWKVPTGRSVDSGLPFNTSLYVTSTRITGPKTSMTTGMLPTVVIVPTRITSDFATKHSSDNGGTSARTARIGRIEQIAIISSHLVELIGHSPDRSHTCWSLE